MHWRSAILALLMVPTLAAAKSWETPAACQVAQAAVHAHSIAPLSEAELLTAGEEIINGKGRFWRVTSPDGAVSHLWGTFHTTDPLILDLPAQVMTQIDQARAVLLEADFTFPSRDEIEKSREYNGWFRLSYSELELTPEAMDMPQEVIDWVIQRLADQGYDQALAPQFTEAAIANLLLSDPCDDFVAGTIPNQDSYIQTLGHIAGAQIIGLEDPDAYMDHLVANPQTAMAVIRVYGSYLSPKTTYKDRATSIALYNRGLIGAMVAWDASHVSDVLGPKGKQALQQSENYLLTQRNLNWLPVLQAQLDKGGAFVAVGAFHLSRPTGLVELIRAKGYTVQRVALPGEDP